jgi:RimJ/RimL family protein N-acetyltransferase
MPNRTSVDRARVAPGVAPATTSDWCRRLPALGGTTVVLRELRSDDAPSLFALLTSDEVARFISPPPSTLKGFEQFIAWAQRQRAAGTIVCFAITINDTAIGLFQLRRLDNTFELAEWGFAIGSEFWGSGIFMEGASLMLRFAFDTVGVRRLEARASVKNGRGNGALRKLGAVQEAVLRQSFWRHGEWHDQVLWAISADEWRHLNALWNGRVH